jgi:hypothetical protein
VYEPFGHHFTCRLLLCPIDYIHSSHLSWSHHLMGVLIPILMGWHKLVQLAGIWTTSIPMNCISLTTDPI